jgi:Putative GTPase activating protein for Arf
VSKVKSVDLDDWTEEQLEAARTWGNLKANAYWEHSRPASAVLTRENQNFWTQKYRDRAWCPSQTLEEFLVASQQRKRDSISSLASAAGGSALTHTSTNAMDTSSQIRNTNSDSLAASPAVRNAGLRRSATEYDTRSPLLRYQQRPESPLRRSTDQDVRTPSRPPAFNVQVQQYGSSGQQSPHHRSASASFTPK